MNIGGKILIHQTKKNLTKLPPSEPVQLTKLVEYADDSIVSREIVRNSSGTISIFAFDAGQALSEHSAPFDSIVQILDGEGKLTIGGKKLIAKTGESVLMPANVPHAVSADKRFKMQLIMLKGQK